MSLELRSRGTADFSQGEMHFIDNTTTLIRFGELTHLTAAREPPCQILDPPPIDLTVLSQCHGAHFDEAAAWEFDETRPIVSTPDAVDTLAALGFEQGRLAVRLRRN